MPEPTRESRSLERHTGADALLKFDDGSGYKEIPVTNVSWTRDNTTEQIQHNGSLSPTLTTTEVRYSGSFEYSGQNPDALDALQAGSDDAHPSEPNRSARATLTVKEYNHDGGESVQTITFKRVMATSVDRDVGSGDVSTTSVDWEAEDMMLVDNR